MSENTNTHESLTNAIETKVGSERTFGFVFSVFFVLLGGWNLYKDKPEWGWCWIGLAGLFAILALTFPRALKGANVLWFRFGLLLHKFISPLILGFLFFSTITPTALIMRMLGKDLLNLRLNSNAKSYWIHRNPPGPEPKSMSNQF